MNDPGSPSVAASGVGRRARRSVMFVLALALVAAGWELYKWLGPQDGGEIFGWKLLPRAKDRVMPHVVDILTRFADPINPSSSVGQESVFSVVMKGVWFSFRLVLAGFRPGPRRRRDPRCAHGQAPPRREGGSALPGHLADGAAHRPRPAGGRAGAASSSCSVGSGRAGSPPPFSAPSSPSSPSQSAPCAGFNRQALPLWN